MNNVCGGRSCSIIINSKYSNQSGRCVSIMYVVVVVVPSSSVISTVKSGRCVSIMFVVVVVVASSSVVSTVKTVVDVCQ